MNIQFKMVYKIKSAYMVSFFLCLLIACKNDKKTQNNSKNNIKKEAIVKKDTILNKAPKTIENLKVQDQNTKVDSLPKEVELNLDITIKSLADENLYTTYNPENYKIEDYVFNTYWKYSDRSPREKYLKIPYIVKHKEGKFFNNESYPDELITQAIPNVLDTLYVTKTNAKYSNCLSILKIRNNKKELYYKIASSNGEIIASKGNLDSLLIDRGLTSNDLDNEEFIFEVINDWKEDTKFAEELKKEYTFSHHLKLKKKPSISKIKTEIDKLNFKFNSLDSLKFIYKKYINTNGIIMIDNFLCHEYEYGYSRYFHSGDITSDIKEECMALIESIDIIYVSKKNKLFKVRWLNNWNEETDRYPLDDNYVEFKNNFYGINDWREKKIINLFHPDMLEDKYLVLYELKLKYVDTYIHSPVGIINYERPK